MKMAGRGCGMTLCFSVLISLLQSTNPVHLSEVSLMRVALDQAQIPHSRRIRAYRQQQHQNGALMSPQMFPPPLGAALQVPIPTNIGHYPGGSYGTRVQQTDKCPRDKVEMEDGSCQILLTQANCNSALMEVILDPETSKGICVPRLCPPDRIFVHNTQKCHDPLDMGICPPGRELYYSAHGTPVCSCPDGTIEGDDDLDDDVCELVLGESLQCARGQVFWFRNFQSPPECLPDPCNGLNLNKGPNELPYVPSETTGECLQIGKSAPTCPKDTWYSLKLNELKGKCATLEEAGYTVLNNKALNKIKETFGPPVTESRTKAVAPNNQNLGGQNNFNQNQNYNQGQHVNHGQNFNQNQDFNRGPNHNQGQNQGQSFNQGQNFNQNQGFNRDPNRNQDQNQGQNFNQNQGFNRGPNQNHGQNQAQNHGQNFNQDQNSQPGKNFNQGSTKVSQGQGNFNQGQNSFNNQGQQGYNEVNNQEYDDRLRNKPNDRVTNSNKPTSQMHNRPLSQSNNNNNFNQGHQALANNQGISQGQQFNGNNRPSNNNFDSNLGKLTNTNLQKEQSYPQGPNQGNNVNNNNFQDQNNIIPHGNQFQNSNQGSQGIRGNVGSIGNQGHVSTSGPIQTPGNLNVGQIGQNSIIDKQGDYGNNQMGNNAKPGHGQGNIKSKGGSNVQSHEVLGQNSQGQNQGQSQGQNQGQNNFQSLEEFGQNNGQHHSQGQNSAQFPIHGQNSGQFSGQNQGSHHSNSQGQGFNSFNGHHHGQFNSPEIFGPGSGSGSGSQMNSPEIFGPGGFSFQSPEVFGGPGIVSVESFGNRQSRQYGLSEASRINNEFGIKEQTVLANFDSHYTILPNGKVVKHQTRHVRSIKGGPDKDFHSMILSYAKEDVKEHTLKRKKRGLLSHASPSNVFQTRLLGCKPGAVRDINQKCRLTILPQRIPRRRGTRAAPPINPNPSCPRGMAFNIRRQCAPFSTAQNSFLAYNLG